MSHRPTVHLGYEVGTGKPVEIPLRHLAVTGQTQEAGKTTTLEALIDRSGLRAITFITKRGEGSFLSARRIQPYFREQTDWVFVSSLLEASRGEKLKFERAWIIKASKGARSLADVQRNVRDALAKAKGISESVYTVLDAYLDVVVPAISSVKWATSVELEAGVNVMDLGELAVEMQHLVIRSTLNWVLEREKGTVTVIPEAWKFVPQGRGTPVKMAAEALIRQGAGLGNYIWLDSQDLGGIEKAILRSVPVWLLGVQRETNEIKRTLDNIPAGVEKPRPADVATLSVGQFYACWGSHTLKTYVQPAWMDEAAARAVATGASAPPPEPKSQSQARRFVAQAQPPKEDPTMCTEHARLQKEVEQLRGQLQHAEEKAVEQFQEGRRLQERAEQAMERALAADRLGAALAQILPAAAGVGRGVPALVDEEAIVRKVLARVPAGGGSITVTPPEKLRADFQREESERILAAVRAQRPLAKRVLKLLEALETNAFQKGIAERLGRATGGNSMVDLGKAVKELAELGLVDVHPKTGVRARVRAKIAEDLQAYQAKDGDIQAVYQNVLHAIATEE